LSHESVKFQNSVQALESVISDEISKSASDPHHGRLRMSIVMKPLSNGLNRCTVQIECEAYCGFLIHADSEEADALMSKAIAVKRFLDKHQNSQLVSQRIST
jgi:hypothetical protein